MHRLLSLAALLAIASLAGRNAFATEITAERSPHGAVVKIDGKLFTEYLTQSGNKPILWPIIGPTGQRMTRNWPMEKPRGEKHDHPHQHRCGSPTATSMV